MKAKAGAAIALDVAVPVVLVNILAQGAAVAGIEFDWSKEAPPMSGSEAPMLLPAAAALALSQQARGPVLWVERALGDVRRAAEAGRFECVLRDPLDSAAAEWTARRELLRQAGFRLELQRAEEGTQATIAW